MDPVGQSIAGSALPMDAPVLVAVSGGVDSMVLLHALRQHQVVVAHFNHQLRGDASDDDQQLVEQTARAMGVPIETGRWQSEKNATRKLGLEKAAREARLAFLAKSAAKHQCRWVAMAHHADDQVETFFWRLLRGAGGTGLSGSAATACFPGRPELKIVRPFLGLRKSQLREFAQANGIAFREDESNLDPAHLRNRIRHRLLPWLRDEFHPEMDLMVQQSMELVGADADCVKSMATEWLAADEPKPFAQLHPAIQRQVIWLQLVASGIEPGFQLIEHLRQRPDQPRSINPEAAILRDATGRLQFAQSAVEEPLPEPLAWELHPGWNESSFGDASIRCRVAGGNRAQAAPGTECFDADRVGPCVTLRHWRAGDRFQPIGLGHAAKLQDLFTNVKVPTPEKRKRVIACTTAGDIFWVQGLRIGELAKIRPETRRFLEWHWNPAEPV